MIDKFRSMRDGFKFKASIFQRSTNYDRVVNNNQFYAHWPS